MVKRLGGKAWQRLHRWIYAAGVLACIHYFMQSKLNVSEPLVVAGLFLWLMGYRLVYWLGSSERAAALSTLAGLGVFATLATGLGEAAYYHFRTHAPFLRVLEADLNFHAGIRPAWVVLGIGTAIVLVAALRQWQRGRRAALASA
jgi:sulfoxide reductase heme-binding subunit YedZ